MKFKVLLRPWCWGSTYVGSVIDGFNIDGHNYRLNGKILTCRVCGSKDEIPYDVIRNFSA